MSQIILSLLASVAALVVGVRLYQRVIAAPTSTERANEIADAIRSGAEAFLSPSVPDGGHRGSGDPAA